MAVEIEKKYRLTPTQWAMVRVRLGASEAVFARDEFEENTLYAGGTLDTQRAALRVRRVGERTILTYKERFPTASGIKEQREDETEVADAQALTGILEGLGYRPSLVYEKRRSTWHWGAAEIVLDELPFGFYAEIEGTEEIIRQTESVLGLDEAETEHATYPHLTAQYGTHENAMIAARFVGSRAET